jgi:tetraacyldisaccharide 4'-kinase
VACTHTCTRCSFASRSHRERRTRREGSRREGIDVSANIAGWLHRRWYGTDAPGSIPDFGLRLLTGFYAGAIGLRRGAYRRHWLRTHRIDVPVIVVGNLSVGGSGKTPLVIGLVESLRKAGWNPGVVSRGYGRSSRGLQHVDANTRPSVGGDEPVLIARRTGSPIVVDADRVAAARELQRQGCDVIVADDGLQHYRLHRDIEIEVIDAARGYGNGRLLPAGPLREPPGRSLDCDLHVVNGDEFNDIAAGRYGMRLRGDELVALDGKRRQSLAALAGRKVHAISGIGDPSRFFRALVHAGIEVVEHAFADHHAYLLQDFEFAETLPIVMTEKDAVKCAGFALADAWMLPVRAELPDAFFAAVLERLAAIGAKPKGDVE